MKRRILLILIMCVMCFALSGCENKQDFVEVYNKGKLVFDNISIPIKGGYFYDKHEKFTVDENTIGVKIYFSLEDESWGD